jgi:hypothetical protein
MLHYHKPRKATFTRADAVDLIIRAAGFECAATEVLYCWGMSKMTVAREDKHYNRYDEMKIVEFMEFLARLATKRFPSQDLTLVEKIELVLDRILAVIKWTRNLVPVRTEEESESDDEY